MNETPKAGPDKRSFELIRSQEENEDINRVDKSTPEKVKIETNKLASEIMKDKGAPDYFQTFMSIYEKDQAYIKDNLHDLRNFKASAETQMKLMSTKIDEQT